MAIPERRRYPRYGFQSDVEIEWGSEILRALVTDISLAGMFIALPSPLWVGASFAARLLVNPPLELNCVVRRVLPGRGMGVMFEGPSEETRARLEKLVASLAQP